MPVLLAQRLYPGDAVCLLQPDGQSEQCQNFDRVEVVLFSLPFPANQIVAALILDFPAGGSSARMVPTP